MSIRVTPDDNRVDLSYDELITPAEDPLSKVAVFDERARIIKALNDRVSRTENTYFSIDQIKKIVHDR